LAAAPAAAPLDLLHAATQPQLLLDLNPFLDPAACARLHRGLLLWLQLCVLQDRLGRLVALAEAAEGAAAGAEGGQVQVIALIKVSFSASWHYWSLLAVWVGLNWPACK
jgi:hypothetical protein